jgi:aryl-alcohol dehydrogenase-like predicted oxidoreductase
MMNEIRLPNCNLTVPRLGFGGASLVGGPSRSHSLKLLETAFDCGIRHFDVAPLYGLGSAEDVLGEFASRHRGEITITTKFGIPGPVGWQGVVMQWARVVLRPVVSRAPALKRRLVRTLSNQTPSTRPKLEAADMLRSLDISLKALRSERIDIFLLHEADADDLTDELILTLERGEQDGKIGAWGIGSALHKLHRMAAGPLTRARVLQFEWAPTASLQSKYPGTLVIVHQAIAGMFAPLRSLLENEVLCRSWSERVGLDLTDHRELARLILAAALASNADGVVLFWSTNLDRVRANSVALNARYEEPGRRLLELIIKQCVGPAARSLEDSPESQSPSRKTAQGDSSRP